MKLTQLTTHTAQVFFLFATCTWASAEPQAATNFECKHAVTTVEKQICSNADLALWNQNLNTVYTHAHSLAVNRDLLTSQQLSWTRQVRDACTTLLCLANAYRQRIIELQAVPKISPQENTQ